MARRRRLRRRRRRHDTLLLRRTIDAQGKSRAWINGSAATLAQLREAADHLVDIHGQHAWQSLTRPPAVRALARCAGGCRRRRCSRRCGRNGAAPFERSTHARERQADLSRERERLAWQIGEVDKLAPQADEWETLNAEHQRLSNAQSLMDAARSALEAISRGR